ncbi:hypothetical protein [Vibrio parahaemolyticus]|uniref:hypothetical protein n=1 Tax=Vibrio parahaemolyticus TaxID=670 RepID=UPI00226B3198|nr:hypothetical protein [Vibrio parahaemolyticus]MCX8816996.1 hypothetical protein [Vibrio parahaemolyticus]MDF4579349.1 hypothetical protein [Vibrio parahaemolyticus]
MANQYVYRIQDKKGRGPFNPNITHRWIEPRSDRATMQPFFVTWPDFFPEAGTNNACACMTAKQLKRWFTASEYQKLLSLGYRAVRMQVDAVVKQNDTQCIFKRKKALHKDVEEFELYKEGEA